MVLISQQCWSVSSIMPIANKLKLMGDQHIFVLQRNFLSLTLDEFFRFIAQMKPYPKYISVSSYTYLQFSDITGRTPLVRYWESNQRREVQETSTLYTGPSNTTKVRIKAFIHFILIWKRLPRFPLLSLY